jgi:hypothetical protein
MKEKLLSMTNGQHILYGMICSHLTQDFNYDPTIEDSIKMIELVQELDSPEKHDTELTPSEGMQEYPEKVYEIFWDFYQENEGYILDLCSENNSNIKEIL